MKTAVAIRHVAFEDLGSLAPALSELGFSVRYVEAAGTDFQRLGKPDLLIILGGPISANSIRDFPWLQEEIDFVRERLAEDLPTLGICLGAQIMAKALGARVYSGPRAEIGWAPLQLKPAGVDSMMNLLAQVPVFHWHGETFDLPAGAQLLASTPDCPHQAFRHGRSLALQFHPEATTAQLEHWYVGNINEIEHTPTLNVSTMRADAEKYGPRLEAVARTFWHSYLQKGSGHFSPRI